MRQGKRVSLPYIPVAVRYALDKVVFSDVTLVEHANQTGRMQIVAPCRVHDAARPFPFLPSASSNSNPDISFSTSTRPRFPFFSPLPPSPHFFFFLHRYEKNFVSQFRGKASPFHPKRFSFQKSGWNLFFPSLPPLPSPIEETRQSGVPAGRPGVRGSWLITNVFY